MPNKILKIPDKILHLPYTTSFNSTTHISWEKFPAFITNKTQHIITQNTKIFTHLFPLDPGLLSLFTIISWHVLKIPLMCHNYPGNIHLRRSTPVQRGTGADKACEALFPLIQIILHIKGDSIHIGTHPETMLDRPHNLWSIFLNIYAQRENNYTYDYFQHILIFC